MTKILNDTKESERNMIEKAMKKYLEEGGRIRCVKAVIVGHTKKNKGLRTAQPIFGELDLETSKIK